MRLFIAAELPENLTEALAETSAALRGSVRGRYVGTDSFHITLAFLGEVEAVRVDQLVQILEQVCSAYSPFDLTLGELGSFGRASKATLWQGFWPDEGRKALALLAEDVRSELASAGFSFDKKTFLPHITLMRAAKLDALDGAVLPVASQAAGTIDTITLFRSNLSGERPVYEALHQVSL